MGAAVDAVLEVFTWVGFGGAVVLALVAVIAWAADGTWLPAEAYVDREDGVLTARWFDSDGDANSAPVSDSDAGHIGAGDRMSIWYRLGWHGRMRLTQRPPVLRLLLWSVVVLAVVGIVSVALSSVLLFTSG